MKFSLNIRGIFGTVLWKAPREPAIGKLVPETFTFRGRAFSSAELELIRRIAGDSGGLSVAEIPRTICELLEWKRPNGGLKNHECRQRPDWKSESMSIRSRVGT